MGQVIAVLIEELMNPLLLTGFLLGFFYLYMTATFDFWLNLGIPFKKPTILLGNFGDLLLFRKSQPEGMKEMYNWFRDSRYFGTFRVRSPILFLRDPDLFKAIFVKDFSYFPNRGIPVNSQDQLAGHLFNLEGKKWKGMRSKLTPVFSSTKIKRMFHLLVECQEEFEKLIEEASFKVDGVEVRELAAKFTIDVIGSCAFGIQINALTNEDSEFHKMAKKLSRPGYKSALWRMLRTSLPKIYKILGVQVIDPHITTFFKDVVSEMIKQREQEEDGKRHDFMDLLVELKNKGNFTNNIANEESANEEDKQAAAAAEIVLDENAIAAQAFVFFVAGYETTSNTIAFCLYELALNPDIQEQTRKDILDAIVRNDGMLTYEAAQQMKYVDRVLSETLRKYPPAPLVSRKCEYPYKIPDTSIELPAGMRVVIPIYGVHHDPDYYPSPDTFDPERFTEENKAARHPYTYLPFGEGPRNCIGRRFAMLQAKVGIISFLRHHKVEICGKSEVPVKFSRRCLVTSKKNGYWLKIHRIR